MNRNAPTTSGAADGGSEVAMSSPIGSKLLAIGATVSTAEGVGVGAGVGAAVAGGVGETTTAGLLPLLDVEPSPPHEAVVRATAMAKIVRRIFFPLGADAPRSFAELRMSKLAVYASAEFKREDVR